MAFSTVRGVVERVLKKYRLTGDLDAYKVFHMWSDLVGDRIASHTRPQRIDRDTLFVEVDDPLWLTQLKYMKIDLLGKIDVMVKKGAIKDVRFYLKNAD
jgi:predicted nucleic acid-binding Zn ribbon protein